MTNPLLTTSEIHAGDLLATVDGTEYRAVIAVYKLNGSGAATFYCSGADWSQTPPAIHARYQAQIDRLENELATVRAALIDTKSTPIAVEDAVMITAPPAGFPCPHCAKICQDRRGLAAHIRFKHAELPRGSSEC